MDISRILAHLRQELDHINGAILSLEQLQAAKAKDPRRERLSKTPIEMRKTRTATRPAKTASRRKKRGRIDP